MSTKRRILKQGAEAKLYDCMYLERPTIVKERFKKNYRHPDLDSELTKERIKNEARAITRCKTAGVKTPALYHVDFTRRSIYMQYFSNAITVKDCIIDIMKESYSVEWRDAILENMSKKIGEMVRKMHENNVIHGDLTTSNMLLSPTTGNAGQANDWMQKWKMYENSELVMIDFGLAHVDSSNEDKGVDLYVLERALISTHNDVPHLFSSIFDSYKKFSVNNVKEIVDKFEEVRARGRKRTMIG